MKDYDGIEPEDMRIPDPDDVPRFLIYRRSTMAKVVDFPHRWEPVEDWIRNEDPNRKRHLVVRWRRWN